MRKITFKTPEDYQVSLIGKLNLNIHSESLAALSIAMDEENPRYDLLTYCIKYELSFFISESEQLFVIDLNPQNILAIDF